MSDNKQIVVLLIIVTFIGLAGLFLTGGSAWICDLGGCGSVYVDSYRADLYMNGTLDERFIY
ncbi:MAG TPA: hypothetical protein VIO11_10790, partial [Candidatus Methanoperedens sp.]